MSFSQWNFSVVLGIIICYLIIQIDFQPSYKQLPSPNNPSFKQNPIKNLKSQNNKQIQALNPKTQLQTPPIIFPQNINHIRLTQSEDPHKDKNKAQNQQQNNSIYLTLIISGMAVLALLGITCCIVICVRNIMRNGGALLGHGRMKVVNLAINYDHFYPPLNYKVLVQEIGVPDCQECVICLDQFQVKDEPMNVNNFYDDPKPQSQGYKKVSQQNFLVDQILINQQQPQQQIDNNHFTDRASYTAQTKISGNKMHTRNRSQAQSLGNTNVMSHRITLSHSIHNSILPQVSSAQDKFGDVVIKMTVCGHLLHAQCLDDWLNRQNNCPLCRQQFTDESMEEWERLLGLNYGQIYQKFCGSREKQNKRLKKYSRKQKKQKESQKKTGHDHFQSTISELQKSNSDNKRAIDDNIEDHIKYDNNQINDEDLFFSNYTPKQQYAIAVYRKIMEYHKKRLLKERMNPRVNEIMMEEQQRSYQNSSKIKKQQFLFQLADEEYNNTQKKIIPRNMNILMDDDTNNLEKAIEMKPSIRTKKIKNLQKIHNQFANFCLNSQESPNFVESSRDSKEQHTMKKIQS